MFFRRSRELKHEQTSPVSGEIWMNRFSNISDGESKLDDVTIQAVETSLREAMTLNNEEARALLGRIEYQKENFQAAVQIFDGIQSATIFNRIRFLSLTKVRHRRGRSRTEVSQEITLPAAALLLEAIYLKVKTLEKMGRLTDAAQECEKILEGYELAFPHGLPGNFKTTKLQVLLNDILEAHIVVLRKSGCCKQAIGAYRRALRCYWSPETEVDHLQSFRLQLAVLLLYGGIDGSPCPERQYPGDFVPSSNMEEAILLLLTIAATTLVSKSSWDPVVMEHLCYALSVCGHFQVLAQLYEFVTPGAYKRTDRWYSLALCYSGAGDRETALSLLQKCLNKLETPNDVPTLLLAASICAKSDIEAAEGLSYAKRAVENVQVADAMSYLSGRAWHMLGTALSKQAKFSLSNRQRSHIQKEALASLHKAVVLERMDPSVRLQLGLEYAEQGNLGRALACAKKFLEVSSGATSSGWKFLALVLSAQGRHPEAEMVLSAGIKEAGSQGGRELQLTSAKLQISQGKPTVALETYKSLLLGLGEDAQALKAQVWLETAAVYSSVSQWSDAQDCVENAKAAARVDSAEIQCAYGDLYRAQEKIREAVDAYNTALTLDPGHVESKVHLGAVLTDCGGKSLPVARSYLNDALRLQPRHPAAWYHLGRIHEIEKRLEQAADCFQVAYLLEHSLPVESFASIIL